jgi:hypothetical protein
MNEHEREMARGAVTTMDRAERDWAALFPEAETRTLRQRWDGIQTGFVDEPREAVQQADALVEEIMKRLTDGFAGARGELEQAWAQNGDASTEDLRQALRRYRSFFDRLLAV